jgi:hypothetical protein
MRKLVLIGPFALFFCTTAYAQSRAQEHDPSAQTQPLDISATGSPSGRLALDPNLPDAPIPKISSTENPPCALAIANKCLQDSVNPPSSFTPLRIQSREPRVADRKFWLSTAASAGASLVSTWAGIHCRHRNGVEPCTAHYGEFAPIEATRFGFSAIVVPLIAYKWKKSDASDGAKHSLWWTIPTAVTGFNIGFAIREFNQGCNGPRLPNGGRCQ